MNARTVICGALGGTCPTVANLGAFYLANPLAAMPSPGLMVGMGLFAVLGAIVAIGFGTESPRAAIIAGIAAPAIVSSALDGATTANGPNAASHAARAAVSEHVPAPYASAPASVPPAAALQAAPPVTESRAANAIGALATRSVDLMPGAARAQTRSPASPQMFRGLGMVTIQPVIRGSLPSDLRLEVLAILPGNVEVSLGTITSAEPLTVTLPAQAQAIRVGAAQVDVAPGRQLLNVVIDSAPTLRGDLLWALGAKRSLSVRDVQITPGD
jgi:hypothetical protein